MDASSEDGTRQDSEPTAAPPRLLPVLISVSAVAVAAAHLIWPGVRIDAVTLALIVVAVAPWLGSIFESVGVPGGWTFKYRDLQRQVHAVQRRVEGVERLLFSGDSTPALQDQLTNAVIRFATYLREVNKALDVPFPSVVIRREPGTFASYDSERNEIQLDPEWAANDYLVLREYAHHVLFKLRRPGTSSAMALESGLADYFVASHWGSPELGAVPAHGAGASEPFRDLQSQRRFDAPGGLETPQTKGEIWGGLFWDLRQRLGQSDADRVLVRAWSQEGWPDAQSETAFPAVVLQLLDRQARASAEEAFARRGLTLP
jgi:hypothetical protein